MTPFCHIDTEPTTSAKCTSLYKTEVFSLRLARLVIFALGAPLFSHFQQNARVWCKTAFSVREQHVLQFSHSVHYFLATFSKVHEFVQNRTFQPQISTFWHFYTGRTTFQPFSAKCTSLVQNTVFSSRTARFVIFPKCHYFLATFSKVHEFGAKQRFQFENSTFCNFPTVCTTFYPLSAKCTTLYKTEVISPRAAR